MTKEREVETPEHSYDPELGRLVKIEENNQAGTQVLRSSVYEYWNSGRIRSRVDNGLDPTGAPLPAYEVDFWYDAAGRMTTADDVATVDGSAARLIDVAQAFDRRGKLTERTVVSDPSALSTYTMSYGWTQGGLPRQVNFPDGPAFRYGYDKTGLLTSTLVHDPGSNTYIPLVSYGRDGDGNLVNEQREGVNNWRQWTYNHASGQPTRYREYLTSNQDTTLGYHPSGRLESETPTGAGTGTWHGYDPAGQLCATDLAATAAPACETDLSSSALEFGYTYGMRGERDQTRADNTVTHYAFDDYARLDTTTTNSTVVDYTHDDLGRRTTTVEGTTTVTEIGYDAAGRIHQLDYNQLSAPTTQTRHYTPDGDLVEADFDYGTEPTIHIENIWDHTQPVPRLQATQGNNETFVRAAFGVHFLGVNQPDPTNPSTYTTNWASLDHRNSVLDSNDLDGPSAYTAFGQPSGTPAPWDALEGITYRSNLQSGPYLHLRNRDYDPTTGTFLTPDPLDGVNGTPTLANPYHYTDNDPLNKVDPLGLRPGDDALGGRATPPPPPTPPRKGMGGIGFASPRAPAHHPDAMHDRPWNRDPTPACSDVGSFPEGAIRFTPAMRWANETRAGTFTNEFRVCYGNDQGYAWAHFVELIQYQAGCWVMNFPDGPGNAVDGACAQDYDVWAVEVDYEDGTRQSMGSARTTPLAFYTGDSSMTGHYYFTVPNQASTSGVFGWARSRSFGGSLWVWVYHSSRSHNAAERGSHLFGSGKWAGVRIGFGPGGLGVLDTYNACQGAC